MSDMCSRCCVQPAMFECTERQATWRTVCQGCFDAMPTQRYLYVPPDGRCLNVKPTERPEPPLAWCPLCELPRARLHTIAFLGVPATISSCACAKRPITVLPDGVRSIPMTENHDPGDEDRG